MAPPSTRSRLAALLRTHTGPMPSVTLGFDGFVDEMIHLVDTRHSLSNYDAVPTIAAFGEQVSRSAGHSSLREIVVTAVHPGGCTINMGDGLAALGIPVDAFASLGEPPHPAFAGVTRRFRSTHSWACDPGRTLAFEFADGKSMFSSVTQLAEFTPERVAHHLASGHYATACSQAQVIALTDWTLYPHMSTVWKLLQAEVYSRLTHRPSFFIDLVDPSSRSTGDIGVMLSLLAGFESSGPVTLGLNGNEANVLARVLGLPSCDHTNADTTPALAEALRDRLQISEVVIHHIRSASAALAGTRATVRTPYCPRPLKSTGAGDRFNAGYVLGLLLGLGPEYRLACACGTSGFFVRHARSPSREELATMLLDPSWPE